ncbi:MAG: antitoxin [Chlamydiia bacterium]|nr:antitoxin [Chlamydiia bacterium]
MSELKKQAKQLHISVNTLVLKIVERGLGLVREKVSHNDLDHLAGTWSKAEEKEFFQSTQSFEQIDQELWQ